MDHPKTFSQYDPSEKDTPTWHTPGPWIANTGEHQYAGAVGGWADLIEDKNEGNYNTWPLSTIIWECYNEFRLLMIDINYKPEDNGPA